MFRDKDLDSGFILRANTEVAEVLRTATKDKSGEISVGVGPVMLRLTRVLDDDLLSNLHLPSHEEVENDSLNNLLEFEKDLQPPSGLAVEHK